MDNIVGHCLQVARVLVVCDYFTRYPEAISLKSIDACSWENAELFVCKEEGQLYEWDPRGVRTQKYNHTKTERENAHAQQLHRK